MSSTENDRLDAEVALLKALTTDLGPAPAGAVASLAAALAAGTAAAPALAAAATNALNAFAAAETQRAGAQAALAKWLAAPTLAVAGVVLNGGGGGAGGGGTGGATPQGSFKAPDGTYADPSLPPGFLFPATDPFNTDVSAAPVDPDSAAYVAALTAASTNGTTGVVRGLHPDFGGSAGPAGIPYNVLPAGAAAKTTYYQVVFDVSPLQSDPGPYPIPPAAWIENGPFPGPAGDGNDHHYLIAVVDDKKVYELYQPWFNPADGKVHADSGAVFDVTKTNPAARTVPPEPPEGYTSTDAAGLCVLAGLVRQAEVLGGTGTINHALRFTAAATAAGYVHPATHMAARGTSVKPLPMGARLRLRAAFPVAGYPAPVQVILRALQKYGMFLADNGSNLFLTGTPDNGWNDTVMHVMQVGLPTQGVPPVLPSDFEVVRLGAVLTNRGP